MLLTTVAEQMDIFSAAPLVQGDPCLGSTPHEFVRHLRYPLDASLREKCQRLTQEFVAGVEKIVKNGETIVGENLQQRKDGFETCDSARARARAREESRFKPRRPTGYRRVSDPCRRIVGVANPVRRKGEYLAAELPTYDSEADPTSLIL